MNAVASYARLIERTLGLAGTALLAPDLDAANRVLASTEECGRMHAELDERAIELLARQQPVATDLRTVVATLRMNTDLDRMAVLTRRVADLARATEGLVERIADHGVALAHCLAFRAGQEALSGTR